MLCTYCHKAEAALFVKHLVDHQVRQEALCADCAAAVHVAGAQEDLLLKLLAGLQAKPRALPACPDCLTTYAQFRETGRFGCPSCYDRFAAVIRGLLPRIHAGASRHRGKVPRKARG